jgi:hypothetical protein
MRVEDQAGGWWIELRGPDQLFGADEDAFKAVYETAIGAIDVEIGDDDEMEVSPDGVSMTPKQPERRKIKVKLSMVNDQRDVLLSRLITGWSFEDIPLPYTALSRERLPLSVCKKLDEAISEHKRILQGKGPDPKEATTHASANGSRDVSPDLLTG